MGEIIETGMEGGSPGDSAIVFNVPDLKAMAAKILRRANEVAQQTIAAAKQNAAEQERQARAAGEKKGYAEGLKKAEAEGRAQGEKAAREEFQQNTGSLAGALTAALDEMNRSKRALEAEAEADLLRLSMEIARRIVRREVRLDAGFILPIVRDAVSLTNNRSDLLIWLNPADRAAVEQELPALHAIFSDLGRVELREDEAVERGGVRVLSREGEVDMRLSSQLAALERALVGDTAGLDLPSTPECEPAARAARKHPDKTRKTAAVDEVPATLFSQDEASSPEGAAAPAPDNNATPADDATTASTPQNARPVDAPVSPALAAEQSEPAAQTPTARANPAPAAPSAPAASTASAPAAADGFTPGLGISGDDEFHPGVAKEASGVSALSGLLRLEDIPVDPAQERLIEQTLRERQ